MMRVITALEPQKKDPDRINVYIEGSFAFGLSRIVAAWLKVGQKISDEKIAQMKAQDAQENALQSAIHFLSYRHRSEFEVRKNLTEKEFGPEEITFVVEDLKSRGLLSDESFAREWVENRSALRPRGRRLLAYELKQKRVGQTAIEQALEDLPDEETLAIKAGRKVITRYAQLDYSVFKKKVSDFLYRRGFNFGVIQTTVNSLWAEAQQKNEDKNY